MIKKIFKVGLIGLTVTFLGVANIVKAEKETNIIKNPSFEEVNAKAMPVGWTAGKRVKREDLDKVEMSVNRDEAHSGGVSAYIKRTLDEAKPRGSGWYQYLELAPNITYKASCWIKTNLSGGKCYVLYINIPGKGGKSLGWTSGTTPWTYYELIFTTPEAGKPIKGKECYIYPVLFSGRGEVWIDDVKVEQAEVKSLFSKTLFYDDFGEGELKNRWKIDNGVWRKEKGCLLGEGLEEISIDVDKRGGWMFTCDIKLAGNKGLSYPGVSICFADKGSGDYYQLHLKAETSDSKSAYYIWHKEFRENIAHYSTDRSNVKRLIGFSPFKGIGAKFNLDEWHKIDIAFRNDGVFYFYWDNKLVKKSLTELVPDKIIIIGGTKGIIHYIDNVLIKKDEHTPAVKRDVIFRDNFLNTSLLELSSHEDNKEVKSVSENMEDLPMVNGQ